MTIAIGVLARGGSAAALVSDSMTFELSDRGEILSITRSPEGKRGHYPERRLAFALSGHWPPDGALRPEGAPSGLVEESRGLAACLRASAPAMAAVAVRPQHLDGSPVTDRRERGRFDGLELVTCQAPLSPSSRPLMGMLLDDEEKWAGSDGAIFVAGSPRFWAEENRIAERPMPATLTEAEELAVGIASDYIAEVYGGRTFVEILFSGTLPLVSLPLHVYSITTDGVRDWST